jgi:hypothetical protein
MSLYSVSSPYYSTYSGGAYLDIMNFRNIPPYSDDELLEITSNYTHRPDLLAYDLYSDVNLWWVFAVRNQDLIQDPVFDLTAGIKIFVPSPSTLKSLLGV